MNKKLPIETEPVVEATATQIPKGEIALEQLAVIADVFNIRNSPLAHALFAAATEEPAPDALQSNIINEPKLTNKDSDNG